MDAKKLYYKDQNRILEKLSECYLFNSAEIPLRITEPWMTAFRQQTLEMLHLLSWDLMQHLTYLIMQL